MFLEPGNLRIMDEEFMSITRPTVAQLRSRLTTESRAHLRALLILLPQLLNDSESSEQVSSTSA